MRYLWLALFLLCLGIAPARAQVNAAANCVVPAGGPATPIISTTTEGSHILKAAPGCLLSAYVINGATAGFLLLFNATTVPADGAVTPIDCIPIAANSFGGISFAPQPPELFTVGIIAVFSSTGCLTKTISATGWFHALVQ